MSQNPSKETTPLDTNSAETAEVRFLLDLAHEITEVKVKCTTCDKVQMHQWMKVQPNATFEITNIESMNELMSLAKKLRMCSYCGKLSLKS